MDLGLENDEVGGSVIEEDEREEDCHAGSVGHVVTTTHHVTSLTDLGNAPPLVDLPCDEVLCPNRTFHGFGQAKFPYGDLVIDLYQFTLLPQLHLKMMLGLKVFKIN